jgi:hypothetical protein
MVILDVDKSGIARQKLLVNKRSITAKSQENSCKLIPSFRPTKRCSDAHKIQYLNQMTNSTDFQ